MFYNLNDVLIFLRNRNILIIFPLKAYRPKTNSLKILFIYILGLFLIVRKEHFFHDIIRSVYVYLL